MRQLRRTTLITVFCLAVLGGLGLARKIDIQFSVWYLTFLLIIFLFRRKNFIILPAVILAGLSIGLWRGNVYMQKLHTLQANSYQKVIIVAKATSDAVYSANSQIEFTANNVQMVSPNSSPLAGSFKISGFGEPMIYRGDSVQVSGKLYPMRGSNQARISYAQLDRLSPDSNFINNLTRKFDAGMQTALPEPQASFGLGLLIGQRTNLSAELVAALTAVGLVHIVAVSGYNLTIMIRGVGRIKLGSKYQKLLISLALIVLFVLITGFSASIVRAALVSILSLWAWYYGRDIKPLVLIFFAAALTGFWNPFYIWTDLGWYLSFLAFFGVLVIAPIITTRFFKSQPKLLTMVVIETLSAELMTLPLILMTFSQLSLVALAANALVVPMVPLAMLFSAVAGTAGAIIPQFAGWLAFPARLLLTYMLDIVHIMSEIPSALVKRSISLSYMIAIYFSILLLVILIYHRLPKTSKIIDEDGSAITP